MVKMDLASATDMRSLRALEDQRVSLLANAQVYTRRCSSSDLVVAVVVVVVVVVSRHPAPNRRPSQSNNISAVNYTILHCGLECSSV